MKITLLNQIPVFVTIVIMTSPVMANLNMNDPWGIAMGFRIARIPYPASDKQVADVIPLLFFDNKYVFLRGLTGGIKLYDRDEWTALFVHNLYLNRTKFVSKFTN